MSGPVPPAPTFSAPPRIRRVALAAPLGWLRAGWRDLWRQPAASLFFGLCIALAGALILLLSARLPYLFAAAVTGFLLVAPMLATGVYELSRRHLAGEPARLADAIFAWRRNPGALAGFGMLSLFAGTLWQLASVLLVALLYQGSAVTPLELAFDVLRDPRHGAFFLAYLGAGGVLAAAVFAASVVSVPMLLDRRGDLVTAVATSVNAVAENPLPLALWAVLLMLLCALGFATLLAGMVLILPWLGHASFHAYRALVEPA